MKALSLFAGAGIGEYYLHELGIDVVLGNELAASRVRAHEWIYPNCEMIQGDILEEDTQALLIRKAHEYGIKMILATPPCQGLSIAGSNKTAQAIYADSRNYLILSALKIVDEILPDYFLIENVSRFQHMRFPHEGELLCLEELLKRKYRDKYQITVDIFNAADYGVPQTRYRVVYRIWKKGLIWEIPAKQPPVTLREAIGELPSLESGESSDIENHFARKHPDNQVEWMKHTPTGKSAFDNPVYFPQKEDGRPITGYGNTYKRMRWDDPAPTITMRNEIISSQENVHPGRELGNGLWSDARVLSLRELLIVSSLPPDMDKPSNLTETAFRQLIGEGIPPLLLKEIMKGTVTENLNRVKALSLFAGGGIAETYFEEIGIDVVAASELLQERADFYRCTHPDTEMICGDISEEAVFKQVMERARQQRVTFLLATPPCQGMSTLGKKDYIADQRNSLLHYVLKAVDELNPDYVLLENVPKFIELLYGKDGMTYNSDGRQGNSYHVVELLKELYEGEYRIEMRILNAMNYGVPQSRPRVIIKMYKKGKRWSWPKEEEHIVTLEEAIGDLPSLEAGEASDIKWHRALQHNARQVEALRHTPEGKSAMANEVYYPKKEDGSRVRGFHNTYNRMRWNEPCPARTTNNHIMSGHNNVHPGRILPDGTQSDARVLTFRELLIVSSLPLDWKLPDEFNEIRVREMIGEAIPPLLCKKIAAGIFEDQEDKGEDSMRYDRSSTREKWTIMKYMNDFDLMTTYAYALRSANELTDDNIHDVLNRMMEEGIYHPRYGGSIDTGKFKIIQIAWYMFGYYDHSRRTHEPKRLVFTPLGNLLLDHLKDKRKVSRIFLAMLFGNGFRQPFSKMDHRYNIYAYRLVFQLLRDPRLEGRLYHDEVFYFAMFLKTVDEARYEQLVSDILCFRQKDPRLKYELFKKYESVVAQALHEWSYATGLLESAGIVQVKNDHKNRKIGVLVHGNGSGRRTYREHYITVKPDVAEFMDIMLEKYPYYEKPFRDEERALSFDNEIVVRMYSFYPMELLEELGIERTEQEKIARLLAIATSVNEYATNEKALDCYRFEFALKDAFNLFRDVRAEKIGGAGNTDVECIYYPEEGAAGKFDVEAKARKVKLVEVSAGRLRLHREKIGSQYTIIVTPDYMHAVLEDIRGDQSAIIKSVTLSNYLYQYITRYGRDISYYALNEIIEKHLGEDVTPLVNEYIYSNFGHGCTVI